MARKSKSTTVERTLTTTADSVSPLEILESQQHNENSGIESSKKKVVFRRSNRLKNFVSQLPNNKVPEEIDLVNSDGQDACAEEQLTNVPKKPHTKELSTEPTSREGGMEEKLDFLVQSVKEFKFMFTERNFPNRQDPDELKYRELYIDSQRKIDSLVEENHELTKKLEFARGKAEAYEQMKDAFGNFKEAMLFSNLAKVAEAVLNISSQAGTAANTSLPVVGSPVDPPPPPPPTNNDNLGVVPPPTLAAPTFAANADQPASSSERNQRGRKRFRAID